jgi:hypothetical protein
MRNNAQYTQQQTRPTTTDDSEQRTPQNNEGNRQRRATRISSDLRGALCFVQRRRALLGQRLASVWHHAKALRRSGTPAIAKGGLRRKNTAGNQKKTVTKAQAKRRQGRQQKLEMLEQKKIGLEEQTGVDVDVLLSVESSSLLGDMHGDLLSLDVGNPDPIGNPRCAPHVAFASISSNLFLTPCLWLDWATIQFRFLRPSSFKTALQLVLRPHFLVHFV